MRILFYRPVRLIILLIVVFIAGLFRIAIAGAQIIDVSVEGERITYFELTDRTKTDFGPLTFAGGFVFWSDHSSVGGVSGLRVADDGDRFISVTDWGHWFEGRFVRDEYGRLKGIKAARLAPLRDPAGTAITSKKQGDAEGLEIIGDQVLVSFEGNSRINRYQRNPSLLTSAARSFRPSIRKLRVPSNKGLEALVDLTPPNHSGKPVVAVMSEHALDGNGDILGFISKGGNWERFSIRQKGGYQITDAVSLSDQYLLILERQYSFATGAKIRIRRLLKKDIVAGALVDGKTLLEFDSQYQIDNFEGISVWNRFDGQPMLTIMSDNNFSFLQRNLILEFELNEQAFQ